MDDLWIEILGIVAGILTSVSLIPQVVKVYREKKSEQISVPFILILMSGQVLWISYGIAKKDIPVIATNIFSMIVSIVTLILGIRYKSGSKG